MKIARALYASIIKYCYPLLIAAITLWISATSYTSGTWLSGWDTLHPEFDFALNVERVINGVWREEQGLGALAGHSHMSELPRYVLLYLTSFVFPDHFLRYFYTYLCFIVGPLGIYWFVKEMLKKPYAAFLAALFYIFNIAVFQHFSMPFEMFTTQYGLLPWLLLFALRCIKTGKKKDRVIFSLLTLFAAPMAYAAQLWHVYFIALCLSVAGWSFFSHRKNVRLAMQRIGVIIGLTLTINAFWLLPHVYHIIHQAEWVTRSQINWLFSDRIFLLNKARGSLADVAVLQGPLTDFMHFDGKDFIPVFDEIQPHWENPAIRTIGYALFVIALTGIFATLRGRHKKLLPVIPVFLFSLVFMTSMNPPFDSFFNWIRDRFPVLREALRSPYTKFSLLLLFANSVFFAAGIAWLLDRISIRLRMLFVSMIALLLMIYQWPLMQGRLINEQMKVQIPQEYFALFSYMHKQPKDAHVAVLPAHTFWGWEYYRFGFQGAGFLWFGIPQTTLVRDTDRWSKHNENFYWELSHTIYASDPVRFNNILEKYQIEWLILDRNIVAPDIPKAVSHDKTNALLKTMPAVQKAATFGNIDLYHVTLSERQDGFKFITDAVELSPTYVWNDHDIAYDAHGTYIASNGNSQTGVYYPFRSLFTGKAANERMFTINEQKGSYVLTPHTTGNDMPAENVPTNQWHLQVPAGDDSLQEITGGRVIRRVYDPEILIDGKTVQKEGELTFETIPAIQVSVPKIRGLYSFENSLASQSYQPRQCGRQTGGDISSTITEDGFRRLSALDDGICIDVAVTGIPHRYGSLITFTSRNLRGSPLLFSVENTDNQRRELLVKVAVESDQSGNNPITSSFLIPPLDLSGQGYALIFENESIGGIQTVNDVGNVRIQPFPYNLVSGIRFVREQEQPKQQILVYSQGFDKGWSVYRVRCQKPDVRPRPPDVEPIGDPPASLGEALRAGAGGFQMYALGCQVKRTLPMLFGEQLTDHVLVNNWANGWKLQNAEFRMQNSEFVFVYMPQYLEYAGFAMLAGVAFWLWRYPPTMKQMNKKIAPEQPVTASPSDQKDLLSMLW